jgi:glycosyltransferase involved in cell wall biosynthesis
MSFSISVIIPAYNVEAFIDKAITSALMQTQVNEVVVINDGSTDNTLEILNELEKTSKKIKIYNHKGNINKGRSASRNLGIRKATQDYIAFLDADDYYLENRFNKDEEIFNDKNRIDGVYNAVGFHFYKSINEQEKSKFKLSTITKKLNPDELFYSIVASKHGYLHLNGLTIKKSVFEVIGHFNESLVVAEDSDIIFKMALKCKLHYGEINRPLAVRGIHDNNIFDNEDLYQIFNVKLFESLLAWSIKNKISSNKIDIILDCLWFFQFKKGENLMQHIVYWVFLLSNNPRLIFSKFCIKYFPIIRLRQKLFPFLYQK